MGSVLSSRATLLGATLLGVTLLGVTGQSWDTSSNHLAWRHVALRDLAWRHFAWLHFAWRDFAWRQFAWWHSVWCQPAQKRITGKTNERRGDRLQAKFTGDPFSEIEFRPFSDSNYKKLVVDDMGQRLVPEDRSQQMIALFTESCDARGIRYDPTDDSIWTWDQMRRTEYSESEQKDYWENTCTRVSSGFCPQLVAKWRKQCNGDGHTKLAVVLWARDELYSDLNRAVLEDDPDSLVRFKPLLASLATYIQAEPAKKATTLYRGTKITEKQKKAVDVDSSQNESVRQQASAYRQPLFVAALEPEGEGLSEAEKKTISTFGDGPVLKIEIPQGCKTMRKLDPDLCIYKNEREWLMIPYAPVQMVSAKYVENFLGDGQHKTVITLRALDEEDVSGCNLGTHMVVAPVDVQLVIVGLDLDKLTGAQKEHVKQSVIHDTAAQTGVPPQNIRVDRLEKGSVKVFLSIEIPPGVDAAEIAEALDTDDTKQRVVGSVKRIPGIDDASDGGEIGVEVVCTIPGVDDTSDDGEMGVEGARGRPSGRLSDAIAAAQAPFQGQGELRCFAHGCEKSISHKDPCK